MTTLALHWAHRQNTHPWVREFLLLGGSVLGMAALSQVRLPLPFTPVPLTAQTLGVLLVGAALGTRRGALSLTLYLVLGGLGLPFFAGGNNGWAYLFGPTFGYLLGFVFAAAWAGRLAEHGLDRHRASSWLPFIGGMVIIYGLGAAWLALSLGWEQALVLGVLPFLPLDFVKATLAWLAWPQVWRWAADFTEI